VSRCALCWEDIPEGEEYIVIVKVDVPGTHCTYGRDSYFEEVAPGCRECAEKQESA
jgi:hypothetical protein